MVDLMGKGAKQSRDAIQFNSIHHINIMLRGQQTWKSLFDIGVKSSGASTASDDSMLIGDCATPVLNKVHVRRKNEERHKMHEGV
jgi:hypothetical protein